MGGLKPPNVFFFDSHHVCLNYGRGGGKGEEDREHFLEGWWSGARRRRRRRRCLRLLVHHPVIVVDSVFVEGNNDGNGCNVVCACV